MKKNDVLACYETDKHNDKNDVIFCKIISKVAITSIVHGLISQRICSEGFVVEKEEVERAGYLHKGFKAVLMEVDRKLAPESDIKLMVQEMALALGLELHYVDYNSLINTKRE